MNRKRIELCVHAVVRKVSRPVRRYRRAFLLGLIRGAGTRTGVTAVAVVVVWLRHRR